MAQTGGIPLPGRRAVLEALRSGRAASTLLVTDGASDLDEILDAAGRAGVSVRRAAPERLSELCGTGRHQGVVLLVDPAAAVSVKDLLDDAARRKQDPFIVCLDGVQDPQNVGAVARSALLAGAHGLVLPERRTAGLGPGAFRASAGALASLKVAEVSSLPGALGTLRRAGVWIVGADASGGKAPWQLQWTGPVALVLGGEAEGLSRAVLDALDARVCIPTPGGDLSLNVSNAAAVLCFERVRQAATRAT